MSELRKRGVQSKIEKYDLVGHAISLLTVTPKMSYKAIAEELNTIGDVPEEDLVTTQNVTDFTKSYPEVRKEVLLANRQHMRKMVMESAEFDMLGMLKDMVGRLTFMIDTMEQFAMDEGTIPDPKSYKALTSELRETLKQIESIHKEVYDMEIVREFLIEVIKTLKEVSPEALPSFINKMKGKRENSHIVSELLKGGL